MYKTRIALAFGNLLLLIAASSSYAAATETLKPLGQAQESTGKNIQKGPDNKGLHNAGGRLQINQERMENKRAEQKAKRRAKKIVTIRKTHKQLDEASEREKSAPQERMERMEKTERERPGKTERPNR